MSKRRSIWPDLLTDRRRRKTSMGAMCLYYDLLMCTDDQGIYPLDVDKIILEVIPYFRGDDEEVAQFLRELIENNFIETYTPKGHKEEFLIVLDWHQQGAMSSEYNKYPNKDGIVDEGKKRLGGMQRVGVIKTLANENDHTCPCCGTKIKVGENQKISDVFTITERVNAKSRGSKYAENYSLLCKECSKTQTRHTADTEQTQCVTSVDAGVTYTGIRDKGLGLRDKGLGLRDKVKVKVKQEVANAPAVVEKNDSAEFPFLSKIAKKYHSDVIEVLKHWGKTMEVRIDLNKGAKGHHKRAVRVVVMLSDGYVLEDCLKAVTGCLNSPRHMGKNETGTKYNEISNIFNEKNFDKFIRLATGEQKTATESEAAGYVTPTDEEFDAINKKMGFGKYAKKDYVDMEPENRIAN